jgi:hypothetical protein
VNTTDLATFNYAVQLAQTGQKAEAYRYLSTLVRTNGNHTDTSLLTWLAFTTPDLNEAKLAISEIERLEPNNPSLPGAKNWLASELAKQPPAAPPVFMESAPPPSSSYYQPPQQQLIQMPPQPNYYQAPPMPPQMHFHYQQPMMVGFRCPYCQTTALPRIERRISTAGWVVFTVLLLFTLIFCWIGLLIKEDVRICVGCGAKLP